LLASVRPLRSPGPCSAQSRWAGRSMGRAGDSGSARQGPRTGRGGRRNESRCRQKIVGRSVGVHSRPGRAAPSRAVLAACRCPSVSMAAENRILRALEILTPGRGDTRLRPSAPPDDYGFASVEIPSDDGLDPRKHGLGKQNGERETDGNSGGKRKQGAPNRTPPAAITISTGNGRACTARRSAPRCTRPARA